MAISLNRPDDLPAELDYPAAADAYQQNEIELLTQQELAGNPVLRGELVAAYNNRQLCDRNPLSAGLVLEVPLFDGGRVDKKGPAAGAAKGTAGQIGIS